MTYLTSVQALYVAIFTLCCFAACHFLKANEGADQVPPSSNPSQPSTQQARDGAAGDSIVVVIPTLREAAVLPATVGTLFANSSHTTSSDGADRAPNISVVVVDASGGSECRDCLGPLLVTYRTLHLVAYSGRPSRGAQLNFGALQAKALVPQASILVFLHADTCLPASWDVSIISTLNPMRRSAALGCFRLSLPAPISLGLRVMLWGANIRAKWMSLPYGDQCYFMTKDTFEQVGGFPNVPIMEDLEMVRRISQRGPVIVLEHAVEASPRRWMQKGVLWNTGLNQLFILAWSCGVSHETIYRWYYGLPKMKAK